MALSSEALGISGLEVFFLKVKGLEPTLFTCYLGDYWGSICWWGDILSMILIVDSSYIFSDSMIGSTYSK